METHIPGDMCSPTRETHITSDMCFLAWGTHITLVSCVPGVGEHILETKQRVIAIKWPLHIILLNDHFLNCQDLGVWIRSNI